MILPIRTDSPLRSTPYTNWLLILANVAVFIAQVGSPGLTERFKLSSFEPGLADFVTYAFLHGGPAHLLGNMLFLYIFGNNVNDKMGNLGYLAFYLAGGVFAGVGHVLTQGVSAWESASVMGASGAVAAVTGAYVVLSPRSNITVLIIIGTFEIQSLWFVALFFV